MSGFGSIPWGSGSWGGSSSSSVSEFNLEAATVVDYRTVDLTFSNELLDNDDLLSPSQYAINNNLAVITVIKTGLNTVRLFTTSQSEGTVYLITVGPLVQDDDGQSLNLNQASFAGVGVPDKVLVSGLDARTVCTGQAVFLRWANPDGAARVKIARRLRAWPFDLTDVHDVVYDGPPITSFFDTGVASPSTLLSEATVPGATGVRVNDGSLFTTGQYIRIESLVGDLTYEIRKISLVAGNNLLFSTPLEGTYGTDARVSLSAELAPQTYYYYLVLVSTEEEPESWDIDDASRAFALSIEKMDSKAWLWKHTPGYKRGLDLKPVAEGGGGRFLDRWFGVMGCWLSLMRGHMKALSLLNDPDKAPFHTLPAQNLSLGIEPEGLAYDFDIVRRPLTSLVYVLKRKGSCPGIVETVRMYTKWDAACVEFGLNQCQNGASSLRTWDGESLLEYGSGPEVTQITQTCVDAEGTAIFTDMTKSWETGLYGDSTLRGWIGDIVCVEDNPTESSLTVRAPRRVTSLTEATSPGESSFEVESTIDLRPHLNVQITSSVEVGGVYAAEVFEIASVTPGSPGTITIKGVSKSAFGAGSKVSIAKSIVRSEYTGTGTSLGLELLDADASFVENQWRGYKLLTSTNDLFTIASNDEDTITVEGASPVASGEYAVAFDFVLGASFAERTPVLRYKLGNGVHSTTFEPTYDVETRGTIYDPYNRTYGGVGAPLQGVFGSTDIGIYVLTQVTVTRGKAQSASGSTFSLDTTQPAPEPDSLIGMYLNPNQNQEQFFEILSNTSTEVTVAGNVSSLVTSGQAYYVLRPRDKTRFERVTSRLRKEFMESGSRPHLLFV